MAWRTLIEAPLSVGHSAANTGAAKAATVVMTRALRENWKVW